MSVQAATESGAYALITAQGVFQAKHQPEAAKAEAESEQIQTISNSLVQILLNEMYQSLSPDNSMVIAQLGSENEPVQVQLIVTRNRKQFLDN